MDFAAVEKVVIFLTCPQEDPLKIGIPDGLTFMDPSVPERVWAPFHRMIDLRLTDR